MGKDRTEMALDASGSRPLYAQIKDAILERIGRGEWPAGERLPSENELVALLGVSRMTVNRALRELADEGVVRRVAGVGSFAATPVARSSLLVISDIARDIRARGGRHSATPLRLEAINADAAQARLLDLPDGAPLYHSIIVHAEDGQPVQLEDRLINPAIAPHYLEQDFTAITANDYLQRAAPIAEAEQIVDAVLPSLAEAQALGVAETHPCLLLRRRTWSGDATATASRFLYPGGRFQLGSRYRTGRLSDLLT